ncbi:MAG TPA: hypothetical protein VEK08_11505 [Planctomycetota bacterium]|nr:hypothetical protein [Planctomycetota bacterium]
MSSHEEMELRELLPNPPRTVVLCEPDDLDEERTVGVLERFGVTGVRQESFDEYCVPPDRDDPLEDDPPESVPPDQRERDPPDGM